MNREIKFSFMWQDQKTQDWLDKRYTLEQIINSDPYDDMSDQPLLRNYHHVTTREFTGLYDNEDISIYDGDLLAFDKFEWYRSEFSVETIKEKNDYVFQVEQSETGEWIGAGICTEWPTYCKVAGNIYEQPDIAE